MAWTTPRTWVTDEVVTKAILDTHVRDNLNYLFDNLPGGVRFANDGRISWNVPVASSNSAEGFAELCWISGGTPGTPTWDATNKWLYVTLTTASPTNSIISATGAIALYTAMQLLPQMSAVVLHVDTTSNIIRIGLSGSAPASGDPANGVYFRSTNGGNWFAVVRNASSETATDTGIAASTTTPKQLAINPTATTSIQFLIDGTVVRTESGANIPAATTVLRPVILIETTALATKSMRIAQWFTMSQEVKSS